MVIVLLAVAEMVTVEVAVCVAITFEAPVLVLVVVSVEVAKTVETEVAENVETETIVDVVVMVETGAVMVEVIVLCCNVPVLLIHLHPLQTHTIAAIV